MALCLSRWAAPATQEQPSVRRDLEPQPATRPCCRNEYSKGFGLRECSDRFCLRRGVERDEKTRQVSLKQDRKSREQKQSPASQEDGSREALVAWGGRERGQRTVQRLQGPKLQIRAQEAPVFPRSEQNGANRYITLTTGSPSSPRSGEPGLPAPSPCPLLSLSLNFQGIIMVSQTCGPSSGKLISPYKRIQSRIFF